VGQNIIVLLKNLLVFQKIDIWSKDAIIDCIFVATNISLQVVWFYLEYWGSRTKIWWLRKGSTIVVTLTQWIILFGYATNMWYALYGRFWQACWETGNAYTYLHGQGYLLLLLTKCDL